LRVFFDTNVLVSAFATRGLCADLFEIVLLEHELVVGDNVVHELSKALRQKIKLPQRDCAAIVTFITDQAAEVVARSQPIPAAVDDDDAIVLGEAVGGHAHVFVTGDARILALGQLEELRIISPRAFWEMLQAQKSL
jgi:putative PIN family toxin of toxin-antitoxin system